MIIAHLADLHLGYRAYTRLAPDGRNQREVDVEEAFSRALGAVAELRPDLVVVAGDAFHSVRPPNAAIAAAFRGFSGLAARLRGTPIVIVAGDRDTPRAADTSYILDLLGEIDGVHVVTERVEQLRFEQVDAEVVALPHAALASVRPPTLPPATEAAERVLVAHARLAGAAGSHLSGGQTADGASLLEETLLTDRGWSYVALGHHPTAARVAENAWYAGALEHTSPDPWATAAAERGFVSFDTATREATFHPLPTRAVVDLPHVSARGLEAVDVSDAVESTLRGIGGGLRGAIARLVVTDLSRGDLRRLDGSLLRQARAQALHFVLEARPPVRPSRASAVLAARGISLEAQVDEYLSRIWEPTMDGIDRSTLARLARGYLQQAAEGSEAD